MGCDIHLYKEKNINGQWVAADHWTPYDYGDDENGIEVNWEERFTERNYNLFGLLSSGVRAEYPFSFEARGLPFNACQEVAGLSERWGGDGHGHSYLYLHELKDMHAYLQTAKVTINGMKHRDSLAEFRASIATESPNWDLLYPYCGWSSSDDYEEFSIDVPASFVIGESLQKIIDSFTDIDGDNHRIVFFFDN